MIWTSSVGVLNFSAACRIKPLLAVEGVCLLNSGVFSEHFDGIFLVDGKRSYCSVGSELEEEILMAKGKSQLPLCSRL